jgi:predicted lipoprotein with Yx(FWY)xxD motif
VVIVLLLLTGTVAVPFTGGSKLGADPGHREMVNGDGKTLYAFTNDAFVDESQGQSNCNNTCAKAWPPVPGGIAVDTSKVTGEIRTVTRRDGSSQLAIGDWPLYTAARDEPGEVVGHGSSGSWFAVAPDGTLYD